MSIERLLSRSNVLSLLSKWQAVFWAFVARPAKRLFWLPQMNRSLVVEKIAWLIFLRKHVCHRNCQSGHKCLLRRIWAKKWLQYWSSAYARIFLGWKLEAGVRVIATRWRMAFSQNRRRVDPYIDLWGVHSPRSSLILSNNISLVSSPGNPYRTQLIYLLVFF